MRHFYMTLMSLIFAALLMWWSVFAGIEQQWYVPFINHKYFENNRNITNQCELLEETIFCYSTDHQEFVNDVVFAVSLFTAYTDSLQQEVLLWVKEQINVTIAALTRKLIATNNAQDRFQLSFVRAILQDLRAFYALQEGNIVIDRTDRYGNKKSHAQLRREIIKHLLTTSWVTFVGRPYIWSQKVLTTNSENREELQMIEPVYVQDDLDRFIAQQYFQATQKISLDRSEIKQFGSLYLFKNIEDLHYLWYEVVSHRTRINRDLDYRRFNIATWFEMIWNVRVLNPWETVSFLRDSQFDMVEQQRYRYWKIIFLDEEIDWYGWWLCGGSTALYQWVLLNRWLQIHSRIHSKRYTSLYSALINWERITTPGLDSTIYYPWIDLEITNITDQPIILVNNFDGWYWSVEEIFTLGDRTLRWSIEFIWSQTTQTLIEQQDWEVREAVWWCYRWNINDEELVRCYKEILQ